MSKDAKGSDAAARLMYQRVTMLETHFASLSEKLETVNRTGHKMIDRSDAVANALEIYAEAETPGVKEALNGVSVCWHQLQDHERASLHQMGERVIDRMKNYHIEVKVIRDEIDDREKVKAKQIGKLRNLERLKSREPPTSIKLKHARVELAGANSEVTAVDRALIESMIRFQKKKLKDLKEIMSDLITSRMVLYARGLEIMTAAMESLEQIQPDVDVKELLILKRDNDDRLKKTGSKNTTNDSTMTTASKRPLSVSGRSTRGQQQQQQDDNRFDDDDIHPAVDDDDYDDYSDY